MQELDAVGWAIRLAKRLEALHALGVAHGSISPACMLTASTERSAKAFLADVRRTESAPAFQSPERTLEGESSPADDTWAVAATLYTTLTGKEPFSGANEAELRQKIIAASPAPLSTFDIGDDDLQHILDRAFARDIKQRTTTVSALRHALEEWHPDPNVAQLPPLDDEDAAEEQTMSRAVPVYAPKVPRAREDEVPSAGFDVTAPYHPGDFAAPAPPAPLAGFAVAALEEEDLSDQMETVALRVQKAAPMAAPAPPLGQPFDAAPAPPAAQGTWAEEETDGDDAEKTRALPTANLVVSPAAEELAQETKALAPAPIAHAAHAPIPSPPAQARVPTESAKDLSPADAPSANNRRGVLLIALIALVLTAMLTYAILRLRGAAGAG